MPDVRTRLAAPADLKSLAVLFDAYRQFYGEPPDPAAATKFIGDRMRNGDSIIVVAETGARDLAGFCQLYPSFCSVRAAPICILYDLFVAPSARRAGTGRALMVAAEKLAREKRFVRIDLSTAKTNRAAQSLYESLGWVRDDVFLVYNKRLDT